MKTLARFVIATGAVVLAGCGATGGAAIPNQGFTNKFVTGQRTFQFTGHKRIFEVPSGVYQIKVWAHGGSGANDPHRYQHEHRSIGGYGGRVSAIIPVTPGERFVVYVGGNGAGATGGFNGGGNGGDPDIPEGLGGGGASDVREHGDALSDRILVAGGGGGAGGDGFGYRVQRGYADGGKGGGLAAGSDAPGSYASSAASGGGGGSQIYGGSGGAAESDGCEYYAVGEPGSTGVFGIGGSGGSGGLHSYSAGGGGGRVGGGYFGGGGGGAGCYEYSGDASHSGGGGGGGSSYVESSATNVHLWKGWKGNKHGLVVFDW